jgi:hypothetical protein
MKAVTFHKYGPPDVLAIEDVTKPSPRDNDVLIRIRAADQVFAASGTSFGADAEYVCMAEDGPLAFKPGVCGTVHLEFVKALGADRVIDYTREDFTRGDQRYDVIFDTVAKRMHMESSALIATILAATSAFAALPARANCARSTGYEVRVAENTVTVCPINSQKRSCPDAQGLLRQSTMTGDAIKVSDNCSTGTVNCYVDECVPKGSYRYGFAKPYDCCPYCCGTDYYENANVAADLPSDCVVSGGGMTSTQPELVPWGTTQTICVYAGGGRSGGGGRPSSGGASGAGTGGAPANPPDAGVEPAPSTGGGGCACTVRGSGEAQTTVFAFDGILATIGLVLLTRKGRIKR